MTDRADILGTDPRRLPPTDGLWAPVPAGGCQPFESHAVDARPVPVVAMRSGREMAKVEADRTLTERQRKIVMVLIAHGPLNRFQIHELTGLSENSVNSACNALLKSGTIVHHSYDTERNRERVCLAPPTPPEE